MKCRYNCWVVTLLALLLLGACIIGAGCGSDSASEVQTGKLAVTLPVRSIEARDVASLSLIVSLTKDGHSREESFPVTDGVAAGVVEELFVGQWQLELSIQDPAGDILYTASQTVTVYPGQTTTVCPVLTPAPGTLVITVDLSQLSFQDRVDKAKVTLLPGEYSQSCERTEGEMQLQLTVTAPPRTYDVKLGLYDDTLHEYNLVFASPWRQFTIPPGKTVNVTWEPQTGSIDIGGSIDDLPPAPANLTGSLLDSTVNLVWDGVLATTPDLAGYNVYMRCGQFAEFLPIDTVGPDAVEYTFDGSDYAGQYLYFALSAVDMMGNESARSESWGVQLP